MDPGKLVSLSIASSLRIATKAWKKLSLFYHLPEHLRHEKTIRETNRSGSVNNYPV